MNRISSLSGPLAARLPRGGGRSGGQASASRSMNLFRRFNSLISNKEYFMSVFKLNWLRLALGIVAVRGHNLSHSPQKRKQKWILSTQP